MLRLVFSSLWWLLCSNSALALSSSVTLTGIYPGNHGRAYVVVNVSERNGDSYPVILRREPDGTYDRSFGDRGGIRLPAKFGADRLLVFDIREDIRGQIFVGGHSYAGPDHALDEGAGDLARLFAAIAQSEQTTKEIFLIGFDKQGNLRNDFTIYRRAVSDHASGVRLGFHYAANHTQPLLVIHDEDLENGEWELLRFGNQGSIVHTELVNGELFQDVMGLPRRNGDWEIAQVNYENGRFDLLAYGVQARPGRLDRQWGYRIGRIDDVGNSPWAKGLRRQNPLNLSRRLRGLLLSDDEENLFVTIDGISPETTIVRRYLVNQTTRRGELLLPIRQIAGNASAGWDAAVLRYLGVTRNGEIGDARIEADLGDYTFTPGPRVLTASGLACIGEIAEIARP